MNTSKRKENGGGDVVDGVGDERWKKRRKRVDLWPFVHGGVAACIAEALTFPIDTAKTRLQLQGQRMEEQKYKPRYKGMIHCWYKLVTEEGASKLYSGLSPALLRQAVYGTIKYGLYYTIKDLIPGEESLLKNVGCAIFAGSISSAIANPTDLIKVRMQSQSFDQRSNYDQKSQLTLVGCFKDIYTKEGVAGLWRGVCPTAQRSAVMAGVQLPVYDYCKLFFLRYEFLDRNSASNHVLSSFCAALCACLASSPFDVIRTRLMHQRKLIRPRQYQQRIYKSARECAVWTLKKEGFGALYRGFVPAFLRTGPWNVIFFLVYENLKKLSRKSDL